MFIASLYHCSINMFLIISIPLNCLIYVLNIQCQVFIKFSQSADTIGGYQSSTVSVVAVQQQTRPMQCISAGGRMAMVDPNIMAAGKEYHSGFRAASTVPTMSQQLFSGGNHQQQQHCRQFLQSPRIHGGKPTQQQKSQQHVRLGSVEFNRFRNPASNQLQQGAIQCSPSPSPMHQQLVMPLSPQLAVASPSLSQQPKSVGSASVSANSPRMMPHPTKASLPDVTVHAMSSHSQMLQAGSGSAAPASLQHHQQHYLSGRSLSLNHQHFIRMQQSHNPTAPSLTSLEYSQQEQHQYSQHSSVGGVPNTAANLSTTPLATSSSYGLQVPNIPNNLAQQMHIQRRPHVAAGLSLPPVSPSSLSTTVSSPSSPFTTNIASSNINNDSINTVVSCIDIVNANSNNNNNGSSDQVSHQGSIENTNNSDQPASIADILDGSSAMISTTNVVAASNVSLMGHQIRGSSNTKHDSLSSSDVAATTMTAYVPGTVQPIMVAGAGLQPHLQQQQHHQMPRNPHQQMYMQHSRRVPSPLNPQQYRPMMTPVPMASSCMSPSHSGSNNSAFLQQQQQHQHTAATMQHASLQHHHHQQQQQAGKMAASLTQSFPQSTGGVGQPLMPSQHRLYSSIQDPSCGGGGGGIKLSMMANSRGSGTLKNQLSVAANTYQAHNSLQLQHQHQEYQQQQLGMHQHPHQHIQHHQAGSTSMMTGLSTVAHQSPSSHSMMNANRCAINQSSMQSASSYGQQQMNYIRASSTRMASTHNGGAVPPFLPTSATDYENCSISRVIDSIKCSSTDSTSGSDSLDKPMFKGILTKQQQPQLQKQQLRYVI
ncbi:hypothetical protein GJ496_000062 [Pomphorhynchus laevis]|nr:hypothetical protein GJ496_000062 [Pomphorhynchus laevis]